MIIVVKKREESCMHINNGLHAQNENFLKDVLNDAAAADSKCDSDDDGTSMKVNNCNDVNILVEDEEDMSVDLEIMTHKKKKRKYTNWWW